MNQVEVRYHRFKRKRESKLFPEDTEIVDLSAMSIFDIDLSEISQLKHLKTIKIQSNRLESIDLPEFLPAIESIDLSDNKLQFFDTNILESNESLEALKINGNLLKSIPIDSLSQCSHLEELDISHNHIHALSLESISGCVNLRVLNANNNQLGGIDISPLSNSHNLVILDLSHNWIREIDTTPLSNKAHLRELMLNENPLAQIDLNFVRSCPCFEKLLVNWTKISDLDISPLSTCQSLKILGIPQNKETELNLFPLIHCENLESLNISGIEQNSIDVWPLFGLPYLKDLTISQRIGISSFPFSSMVWSIGMDTIRNRHIVGGLDSHLKELPFSEVRSVYSQLYENLNTLARFHLRIAFIEFYGLDYLRCYDGNILEAIEGVEFDASYESVQEQLTKILSGALIDQIRSSGSTHFLDMELIRSHPVLAVVASDVITSRRQELDCISLIHLNGLCDTTELWYTVYGREIMSALGIGQFTDSKGVDRIQSELSKVGIEVKIRITDCSTWDAHHLSDELKAYLRFLAIRTGIVS